MAQLPPKIPSIMTAGRTMPAASDWEEELSSGRRGSHRRSASDSVAFLDDNDHHLLMSIFCHDISPPESSDSAAVKPEPGEADSPPTEEGGSLSHPISELKRVKRILANRQSAQRSRVRKLHYISELERSVTTLQSEVSALSPTVAFFDHQRLILNVDNSALKQRIAALAQDKIFKDAHQEALKKEIERLMQVYEHQNTRCGNQNARPQLSSTQPNSDDMEF